MCIRDRYRGYDSAGIAVVDATSANPKITVEKEVGKLSELRKTLEKRPLPNATTAIGHTRWATHGGVTRDNAHPHLSYDGKLALIHNGIIENAEPYRAHLEALGIKCVSETDTEVVAHLLERAYLAEPGGNADNTGEQSITPGTIPLHSLDSNLSCAAGATRLARAMLKVTRDLEGSFTLLVQHVDAPGVIVAARRSSPLVLGLSQGTNFLGSDVLAFAARTKQALEIGQDEVVVVTPAGVLVMDQQGNEILHTQGLEVIAQDPAQRKRAFEVDFATDRVTKEGFDTFMEKEIREQPRAVGDTIAGRLDAAEALTLDELRIEAEVFRSITSVIIVACGTASYAGQVARYLSLIHI